MTFGALVGVKDEAELIGACIAQLRKIGVDRIVVSDYGSTDQTLDILADARRAGDLLVESVDVSTVADFDTWSHRETALAMSIGTDWVLFLDADEFWIPASGSLGNCRGLLDADVVAVDRFNVGLTSRQRSMAPGSWLERLDDLLLFTTMPSHFRQHVEAHPEVPFITLMPGGKVMARPEATAGVGPGSHCVYVHAGDPPTRQFTAADLLIAHAPFSTPERFARKLRNIRAELAQNPACYHHDLAWHWKRWSAMTDRDAIDREFAAQILDDAELARLRQGNVVRSAQEIFQERLQSLLDVPRSA
jgi:glycosyl transferase family 2